MPRALSPTERSQRARIAAHSKWAVTNPQQGTEKARAAFLQRFLAEVDEASPGLPKLERLRRAEHLKSAHFARLALASARARRKKSA